MEADPPASAKPSGASSPGQHPNVNLWQTLGQNCPTEELPDS